MLSALKTVTPFIDCDDTLRVRPLPCLLVPFHAAGILLFIFLYNIYSKVLQHPLLERGYLLRSS